MPRTSSNAAGVSTVDGRPRFFIDKKAGGPANYGVPTDCRDGPAHVFHQFR
jgi:hypothetical protein